MALSIKTKHGLNVLKSILLSFPVRIRYYKRLKMDIRQVWENSVFFAIAGTGRISIDKNMHTRKNVSFRADGGNIIIGKNVFLNNNVSITSMDKIEICDGATIANNVVIIDHDHDYKNMSGFLQESVYIGKRVWIGANCTILRGTHIGDDSVIAAGTVVKGTIPENSLCYQERHLTIKNLEIHRRKGT